MDGPGHASSHYPFCPFCPAVSYVGPHFSKKKILFFSLLYSLIGWLTLASTEENQTKQHIQLSSRVKEGKILEDLLPNYRLVWQAHFYRHCSATVITRDSFSSHFTGMFTLFLLVAFGTKFLFLLLSSLNREREKTDYNRTPSTDVIKKWKFLMAITITQWLWDNPHMRNIKIVDDYLLRILHRWRISSPPFYTSWHECRLTTLKNFIAKVMTTDCGKKKKRIFWRGRNKKKNAWTSPFLCG